MKLDYDIDEHWQLGVGYRTLEGCVDTDDFYNIVVLLHRDRAPLSLLRQVWSEFPVQLERLGSVLGEHLGVGHLAFSDWDEALHQLLRLPAGAHPLVVLDELGHILEADRSIASVLARALGPGSSDGRGNSRLVLCGSAISIMQALTAGQAPLRGRAGLELLMQPDDFRTSATRLPNPDDLALAAMVFSVIGGVVG